MTANHGKLNLEYLRYIGFSKIQPYDEYITDSAAGGTAIATGVKTYNGAISVNPDTVKVQTILDLAEEKGLSTGLVTTCDITDATPAAFIAHQKSRDMLEAIAMDYLKTDVDLVIGGGLRHFANRRDGQYVYLREAYNPLVAFLSGWVIFLVLICGSIALLGVAFSEYFGSFFPVLSNTTYLISTDLFSVSNGQVVAVVLIIMI